MTEKVVITIERAYGSGGREVGEKLAKALKIPFYNREIIQMAAKESGMSEEVFEKVDETAASSLLYSVVSGAYTFGNHAADPMLTLPINDKLFILESDIIKKVAEQGSCVIVGRCADYILRDNPSCIKIFIKADKQKRIERAVNKYGVKEEKIEDYIHKIDKKRSNFYHYYSGEKWGYAQNYDLCIDTGVSGIDGAVEMIQCLLKNIGKDK